MRNENQVGDRVFVKDATFAWLPATIVCCEKDRVLVETGLSSDFLETTEGVDGASFQEQRWINLDDYRDRVLPLQNEVNGSTRDCADLPHLHEAAILYQIKERHGKEKPYTRVGEIVVAVNPCKWIKDLYSLTLSKLYAKSFVWQFDGCSSKGSSHSEEKKEDSPIASTSFGSIYNKLGVEPHIYEVSSLAYRGMFLERRNQTILVSGESGAGKTETVKIVLHHLATLETASLLADGDEWPTSNLVKHIIESSPVFEAFGNAATVRNHNSSRFGKMSRLHFGFTENGMCGLRGSSCQTYLLETNRVVSQNPRERNFHIFYQLLSAPPSTKAKLLGKSWEDKDANEFLYLNVTPTTEKDSELWIETHRALEFFGWNGERLESLCQALGAILHLGNIVFTEDPESDGCYASLDAVDQAADALGLTAATLDHALRHRCITTAGERVETKLTPVTAKDSLDTFVRNLYSDIFQSILESVNSHTMDKDLEEEGGIINLLDIYGFEALKTNTLEQLCINYANEMLHKKYVDDNFQRFKIEYEKEGIELFDFSVVDNVDVLELLEGKEGIVNMMNEECRMPNGSSEKFVQKLKKTHKGHTRLEGSLMLKTQFGIRHFAAPVVYDASKFVERNMRRLPSELLDVITKTTNKVIGDCCRSARPASSDRPTEGTTMHGSRRSVKKKTVLEQFRSGLHGLMESMKDTETRYIRCIKPNESLSPGKVNQVTVMRQLECAGLVTAIDLSRGIYPNKLSVDMVADRFNCLLGEADKLVLADMPAYDKVQYMLSKLFAPLLEVYRNCEFTMPYTCGKTKVFFRSGALEMLESLRFEYFSAWVTIIQAAARHWLSRRKVQRTKKGLVLLQAIARGFECHLKFKSIKKSVSLIQARMRGSKVRSLFLSKRRAAVSVQSHWRRILQARQAKLEQDASLVVTDFFRMVSTQSQFLRTKHAFIKVQALSRGRFIRRRVAIVVRACTRIQRFGIRVIAFQRREDKRISDALVLMQTSVRRYLCMRDLLAKKEAARTIVSFLRSTSKRAEFRQIYLASVKLQAFLRMKFVRATYHKIRRAAVRVQSFIRMAGTRIRFITVYMAALKVQAFVRMALVQTCYTTEMGTQIRHEPSIDTSDVYTTTETIDSKETPAVETSHVMDKKIPRTQDSRSVQRSSGTTSEDELEKDPIDKEEIIHQLRREIEDMKEQEKILRDEIAAVVDMAKEHEQKVDEDYEDRIQAYEDEVMNLKDSLEACRAAKDSLAKEMEQQHEKHSKQLECYKQHAISMQKSHAEYIQKVSETLRKAKESHQKESTRVMTELDIIKHEKEDQIKQLSSEIIALRANLQEAKSAPSSGTKESEEHDKLLSELRHLEKTIMAAITPSRVLHVVQRAERKPWSKETFIEEKISLRVGQYVSRLVDLAGPPKQSEKSNTPSSS